MPRPDNPTEALFWDRERLKHGTDADCDAALVLYACRRLKALGKDYIRSQQGLPPERRYVSELDKRASRKST